MALTLTTPNTVLGVISPKSQSARLALNVGTVILGSLLLAAAARISVPVTPVPVTLQSLAVALLAAAFGWRIGVATVALYIVEGLAGLPVFAAGGGLGYLMSPSFGFIAGWLPMA
jgi:biotin transport system substrate-specific component